MQDPFDDGRDSGQGMKLSTFLFYVVLVTGLLYVLATCDTLNFGPVGPSPEVTP